MQWQFNWTKVQLKLQETCLESNMQKARKFKKKLAQKPIGKKSNQLLSVELIRKESLEKLGNGWKKLISSLKSFKLAN